MDSLSRRTMITGGVVAVGSSATAWAAERAAAEESQGWEAQASTVRPGDPRYADLRTGSNQRWMGRPEYIRVAGTTAHVVQAVTEAVKAGRRVVARSGGNCFEDFVTSPDVQVVVDLSQMRAISYDRAMRAIAVEAGALVGDVYRTLFTRWGVVIPAGICQNVGMGGHVAGGAYGALNRLHGLAVDHLYAVEVVVVGRSGAARAVVATREPDDPHRELWWAHTGGGGGNFGIVTRYWFRTPGAKGDDPAELLPKPPPELLLHVQNWPWAGLTQEGFSRLVRNAGTWFEANSAPDSPYNSLFSHLRLTHQAHGTVTLAAQLDATRPDAEKLMSDFTAAIGEGVGVAARQTQHRTVPWVHGVWWNGFAGTNPNDRAKYKSAYLRRGFTDDQIAAIYRNLTRADYQPHLGSMVQLVSYGGRVNTVAPEATAVPQRDSVLKVMFASVWQSPADDAKHLQWIRECYRDTFAATGGVPARGGTTDGCFVNYADVDLNDPRWNSSDQPWHELYYGGNYARLRQVKTRWDPRDVFRHAQSVQPLS
ncbi:FAD-binding oxidoreductase [Nonomuraea dietziae]|uniref:FAD-binding oxidoreductase n=1 Tax=Nonomuraea dietziae TaxID=65515 RepID=UPI0033FC8E27